MIHAILFVEEENDFTLRIALVYLHREHLYTVEQQHDIRAATLSRFDWLSLAREHMEKLILNLIYQSDLTSGKI